MKKLLTGAIAALVFCFMTGITFACEGDCKCGCQEGTPVKCSKTCAKTCKCHKLKSIDKANIVEDTVITEQDKTCKCKCGCNENSECTCKKDCKCNKFKGFRFLKRREIKCNCEE